ncbi:hypothetical protein F511_46090 [Dorcoceras hygrometricum]|uniref:Uncharacterized protein n=1 Tax=Dorcoceras hygrometricum TaxID=472368 RepID=A0A2Z6ZUE0_9LAMI|nr:hypothetical protein F511_46090 [Dorcoceras hygrometricum]
MLIVINSSPDGTVTARATPMLSGTIPILCVNALKINEWVSPESSKASVVTPSTRIYAGSWPCWSTHVDRLLRSDAGAGRALAAREAAHSRALAARLCRTIALRSPAGCFVDCALVAYPARLLAVTSRDACGVLLRMMRAGRATLRTASCAADAIFVVVAPAAAPSKVPAMS